jgi:hypothetical protein
MLVTSLEEGELGLAETSATVAKAHALLAALSEALPPHSGSPVPSVRRAAMGEAPALDEQARAAWHEAREFLRRHFTGRHGLS